MYKFICSFPICLLNNAAIHHTQAVIDAVNAMGAIVLFLPPYSPDFMLCMELFAQVKSWIRENDVAQQFCMDPELMVEEAFLHVIDEEIKNYFRHAEYFNDFVFTAVTNQVYQELSSIKTRSVLTRACPSERKTCFH